KTVNFGTLYGQGLRGLIAQALQHGIVLDADDAAEFQRRFAAAWPQLWRWRERQMRGTGPLVRTASDRLRWIVPVPERHPATGRVLGYRPTGPARVNTPVQGLAAD